MQVMQELTGQLPDIDPQETREWLDSIEAVTREDGGAARARFLIRTLLKKARMLDLGLPMLVQTPYVNTISPEDEPPYPGDERIELRIRRLVRWNAVAMVMRANIKYPGIGGHMATYASAASLYETGFNHFFRGKDNGTSGDHVFFQGHGSPGIYARAFLEGRLTEDHLHRFRREVEDGGLPSYPHPRTMPDFWEFPTVSMGLGPMAAVYLARFNRYLHNRGIKDTSQSRVWCFIGDGESDEPEALGALSLAAREKLDNLIFVVNCNLQRLDGPVRGNGKIIQELEARFKGAGWNVFKVVWGREWDELIANDDDRLLLSRMSETPDGQFQKYSVSPGSYIRDHFFREPKLKQLVAHLSDDQLHHMRRGGHDFTKVYAAFKSAVDMEGKGAPTVILAHTVKGWTLGGFQGANTTHNAKKLDMDELRAFRDRIRVEIPDDKLADLPFYHPGPDSEEVEYMIERRRALGGFLPKRNTASTSITVPEGDTYDEFKKASKEGQEVSTTMAAVRLLTKLLRDPLIGKRIVPIIPDEARTFGMEGLFRTVGIYSPVGQTYEPVDKEMLLYYKESVDGQMLMEGITEAGAMSSFVAAGTSHANHGEPMIPFYFFYSMFGLQRTGDQAWLHGDARGRGFLMAATAGRTTLNGEGLQHEDGHSHVLATCFPSIVSYDPAFAYEIAVIVEAGIKRMYHDEEDITYQITLQNENYAMPAMPEGVEDGILKGMYLYEKSASRAKKKVRLVGSGSIMMQVLRARDILAERYGVAADIYSATSYKELRTDALSCDRWNRFHPTAKARVPYITKLLGRSDSPIIAASDFMKLQADQIAQWVPAPWCALGTDGWGRSDTREALRRFFEVDAETIAAAALYQLSLTGKVKPAEAEKAIKELGIDPEKVDPVTV